MAWNMKRMFVLAGANCGRWRHPRVVKRTRRRLAPPNRGRNMLQPANATAATRPSPISAQEDEIARNSTLTGCYIGSGPWGAGRGDMARYGQQFKGG
jgi:hypothetical protein